ncbi:hypothetical protein CcCBS67573_g07170 [Chytriomyces confervae]|uniref:Uncharacterized protein n=1 Tax=Chytriomyces confervae TaxID=246404 RepID=A0A507EZ95_9FUNG|nr:hypothetical protein CcCBS67573_g07170 [Chytriomyces confervae]
MKAVVLAEPFRVEVRNVAAPSAEDLAPGEAIVKVALAGLCGSDLHVYRGNEPVPPGVVTMGHEFVGTVVAYRDINGKDTSSTIRIGSVVVAPFTTSCLRCVACQRGFTSRCEKSQLFGSVSLSGGQAEFVTVPNAEGTLLCVDTLHVESLHSALLCADILPTGFYAVLQALTHNNLYGVLRAVSLENSIWSPQRALNEAPPVPALEVPVLCIAVVGLGPVGTCALVSLLDILLNPTAAPLRLSNNSLVETRRIRILMIDGVKERRDAAVGIVDCIRKTEGPAFFKNAEFLAMDIDEARAWSVAQSDNNRADAVIEAVGANEAVLLAYGLLRSFGVLSSVGVHTAPTFPLTGDDFYNKNVALSFGRCPVRGILPLVLETLGRRQDIFAKISSQESDGIGLIDRIVDVSEATEMYKLFNDRKVGKRMQQPATATVTRNNSKSDSDEGVGPMPIPQEYADAVNEMELARTRQEIESRIENQRKADEDAAGTPDGVAVRGDWMLVPPEVKKLTSIFATEMKNRQFQRATTKEETVDQSGWTKLPGEKSSDSLSRPSKRKLEVPIPKAPQMDPSTQAAIDSCNKANRPKTLMEMHTTEYGQSSKFADNDASARKFDRDRDLSSRRTDSIARRGLVDGAKNLSSRFSGGGK